MKLLNTLTIDNTTTPRRIELYEGDLTELSVDEAVDVLVVSVFPDGYHPSTNTLVGALHHKLDVSVKQLADNKAFDLRGTFSCWMSEEINSPDKAIPFKRILCFEPLTRGHPAEVIGDIFQSLTPFVTGEPAIRSLAMPVVAAGKQGAEPIEVLAALFDAAVHWFEVGLPLETIKIVEVRPLVAAELKGAFTILKKYYHTTQPMTSQRHFTHDLFISYSHENTQEALFMVDCLRAYHPDLRIYIDRMALDTGSAWQQELYDALDTCEKVIALYSPPYLTSKVCREEFNIALFRHRNSKNETLIPIYLYSADLPSYMHLIQFIDCREGNRTLIRRACESIAGKFNA